MVGEGIGEHEGGGVNFSTVSVNFDMPPLAGSPHILM